MGLQISSIVDKKGIEFKDLNGKIIAVDAFNAIYQFLSTIRQPDGTPLMDSKKRITSHLSGLFYRNINLLNDGIKLIYVFDGTPPKLKEKTKLKREEIKYEAQEKYEKAVLEEDIKSMRKYSQQTTKITKEIIQESKDLLKAMGIAIFQAPGEGEAQAAYICKKGDAYAVASQDYDSLLFGAPRLIQNMTLARKKRLASGNFVIIQPMMIELEYLLNKLQLTIDQLICLGILTGTDYNPGGVKGIGPKNALKIVNQYKQPSIIFEKVAKNNILDFDWKEIFELFKKPDIDKNPEIKFEKMDKEKILNILVKEHDFSEERILNALSKLEQKREKQKQQFLNKFF